MNKRWDTREGIEVEGYNEPSQKPFIFFVHQTTKRNDNDWKLFHLLLLAV